MAFPWGWPLNGGLTVSETIINLPTIKERISDFRGSEEREEGAKENFQKTRKTRRAKEVSSADNGSNFPKLAYLTVEEYEEIPK